MIEKHVFVENPLKSLLISSLLFGLYLLIALPAINFFFAASLPTNILIGVLVVSFALPLLLASFMKRKVVICDSVGCEVRAKNSWQKFEETDYFKWSQVTETNIVAVTKTNVFSKWIYFEVVVGGQTKRLLKREWFSAKSFDNLVDLANQATQHLLPYLWVKGGTSFEAIEKAGMFRKVSRR